MVTAAPARKYVSTVTHVLVKTWFDEALPPSFKTKPGFDVYESLADKLRKLIHRVENKGRPIEDQLDATQADILAPKFIAILEVKNELLFLLEDYMDWDSQTRTDGTFGFSEIAEVLAKHDTPGVYREPARPARGQPPARWHEFGKLFAKWVSEALIDAGFTGDVDATNPDSATALIGASMVNYVSPRRGRGKEITADTFAAEMKGNRKSRAKNPKALFAF